MDRKLKIYIDSIALSNFKTIEEYKAYLQGVSAGFEFAEQNINNKHITENLRLEVQFLKRKLKESQGLDI